jgi:hypothetical protein
VLFSQCESLGVALVGDRLRLIAIEPDNTVKFLDPRGQSHNLLYVVSVEAYGLKTLTEELEGLINSPGITEDTLQAFFEEHPKFLCGDAYETAQPHIFLQRPDSNPLIPDFALKPPNADAFCDLLELKLPQAKLVVGRNNRRRLSAAVWEAHAQLREYRDYFESRENREAVERVYGLRFFRPKMIVVIGKRSDYVADDLRKAESEVPQLTITTYDDLLERSQARLRQWGIGR